MDPVPASIARPNPKTRLRRRSYRWLIWLSALAIAIGGAWAWLRSRADVPIAVQTVQVGRGSVRDFVTSVAAGRVSAKQEATVRAEIAGTVKVLHHHRGDKVVAGEPLLTYDADELKERLHLAEAAVAVVKAQVKQAEEGATLARTNLVRAQHLRGAIPEAEIETLEGQSHVQDRAVDAARAAVSQSSASVLLARTALDRTIVRAPFAATVIDTKVEVGETLAPGTVIAMLADVSALHVDAEIDEADLSRIKLGMPADVTFDALPGERIRGKLTSVAPSVARDARGGKSVAIDLELPPDGRLLPGMSADVDIIVAIRESALWVPPNAVLGRGADRSVYLVEKGVAHKRSIEVGISTWEAVEIKKGVEERALVVSTLSAAKLEDGVRVTTSPAPQSR